MKDTLRYACIAAMASAAMLFPSMSLAENFNQTLDRLLQTSLPWKGAEAQLASDKAEASTLSNFTDPEIEGEYLKGTDGSNRWNAGLSWSMEWPGVYSARSREARALKEEATIRMELNRQQLRLDLGDKLIEYIRLKHRINLSHNISQANDTVASIIEAGIRHGKLTELDSHKINIERGRLALALQEDETALETCRGEILALSPREGAQILNSLDLEFPSDPGHASAYYMDRLAITPAYRLANAQVAVAKSAKKSALAETLPSVSVGYIHAFEEKTHFNGGKLGFSIPVFSGNWKKKAAEAAHSVAEINAETRHDALMEQVKASTANLESVRKALKELAPVFDTTSPQAMLLKAYQYGRLSLIEYLQERNYYREAELDFINLQATQASLLQALESL